jgi:hypothetical protein
MGKDAGRLLGEILRRKHNQGFESDLVTDMIAEPDLANIPLFLSHMVPPNYIVIL